MVLRLFRTAASIAQRRFACAYSVPKQASGSAVATAFKASTERDRRIAARIYARRNSGTLQGERHLENRSSGLSWRILRPCVQIDAVHKCKTRSIPDLIAGLGKVNNQFAI